MTLKVCAWHPKNFGRRKLMGFGWWRPFFRLEFTDGMCRDCLKRAMAEQQREVNEWLAKQGIEIPW